MARPVMERRNRVRVEFSLSPELAEKVYVCAQSNNLTLSQTGERLLALAFFAAGDVGSSSESGVSPNDLNGVRA